MKNKKMSAEKDLSKIKVAKGKKVKPSTNMDGEDFLSDSPKKPRAGKAPNSKKIDGEKSLSDKKIKDFKKFITEGTEWGITAADVDADYDFYSDMYKSDIGVRPRFMSSQELADYLNDTYELDGKMIVRKDGIKENKLNNIKGFSKFNENVYTNQHNIETIETPIIPDAIRIISKNPNAIKFTNKNEYDNFAKLKKYFSASHAHCFYNKEEVEHFHKNGSAYINDDAKESDIVFEVGHKIVQVWDNLNNIGYIIPADKSRD